MSDNLKDNWYYAEKGKVIGAISLEDVKKLISEGKIKEETSVWSGEGDWRPAKSASIGYLLLKPEPVTDPNQPPSPPPLSGKDINNKYVWGLVAVPVIGVLVDMITGSKSIWIFIAVLVILNIAFFLLDDSQLKKSGHRIPTSKWLNFLPVYLWRRTAFLKQKHHYFWGWIASLVLSVLFMFFAYNIDLEGTACPVVTQIMHESYGNNSASCKVVVIDREVSDGFYKATATLDNGNDIGITIEERSGNQIYVQIAP